MVTPVACEGAPRDLGSDQGRACGKRLSALFGRESWAARARLRAGLDSGEAARLGRDLRRHLPHLAESLAGLAQAAGVPAAWLREQLLRGEAPASAAALEAGELCLGRGLEGDWILRRSRPEGLFASLEVTRPWLPAALAGVNERGLAVVAMGEPGGGGCAAPGWLLGQDCLERFERLEAALEWCLGRPGGGRATLLLADAGGEAAGVEIAGDARRVLRPAGGLLACRAGGPDPELAKRLQASAPGGAAGLAAALSGVAVEPRERRIRGPGLDLRL